MHSTTLFLAPFLLSTSLAAQISYTVTPRGTDLVELNSSTGIAINWGTATTRIQQADNGHLFPRALKSMAWRRNGTAATTATHSVKLDLSLGHGNFANFTTTFSTNYSATPTKVFSGTKTLDWTKASTLAVGMWSDATFPLSSIFVYSGKEALIWESQTYSINTTTGYSLDWGSTAAATRSWYNPQVLGTGCTTSNGTMTLSGSFSVDATPTMSLVWNVSGASNNVPVRVYAGITNPNAPFLCGKLHTDAAWFFFSLPNSSSTGVTSASLTASWLKLLAGAPFTVQAIALDASAAGGGYLSNGLFCRMPEVVGGTAYAVKRIYSTTSATAVTGTAVTASCQPTRLD